MNSPLNGRDIQRPNFEVTRLLETTEPRLTVGASLLGLVTLGISDNPLVMYREYIQNSVDALAGGGQDSSGRVEVLIDRKNRRVRIRDNGPGLSYQGCVENLLPIGRSKKTAGLDRGFRGIGRLSGLAFASSVTFLTRSRSSDPVTCVVWPGVAPFEWEATTPITDKVVQDCVTVQTKCGANYPDHFFEVQVDGIGRHAAGTALNRDAVRAYISEACPVPMAPAFPFSQEVCELFDSPNALYVQEIVVCDDPEPVKRQYGADIQITRERKDRYTELEPFRILGMDGRRYAAIGWVAHSTYLGAIPKGARIRGMRARVGNIQIGGERVFDHLFLDDRFNRWCVGEVHVLDAMIVPNARRDYFEQGPHLRHLENHLSSTLQGIERRCKTASALRSRTKRAEVSIASLEETQDLVGSGYLSAADARDLAQQVLRTVPDVRKRLKELGSSQDQVDRLEKFESALTTLDFSTLPSRYGELCQRDVQIYQQICRALVTDYPSAGSVKGFMDRVLTRANPATLQ